MSPQDGSSSFPEHGIHLPVHALIDEVRNARKALMLSRGDGFQPHCCLRRQILRREALEKAINSLTPDPRRGPHVAIAPVSSTTHYASVLDEGRVARFLLWFYPQVSYSTLNRIYRFLMSVKPVLLTSASFVVLTTFLMTTIPWVFIYAASRKTRGMIERERIWR
jgi:hypothetical protein